MTASRTMRAAFYEGPRKFSTGTLPVPEPGTGEALSGAGYPKRG